MPSVFCVQKASYMRSEDQGPPTECEDSRISKVAVGCRVRYVRAKEMP